MISLFHELDADFFIVGFDVPVFQWDESLNRGSECIVTVCMFVYACVNIQS